MFDLICEAHALDEKVSRGAGLSPEEHRRRQSLTAYFESRDQRAWPRVPGRRPARLLFDRKNVATTIVDAARDGFRIEGDHPLRQHQQVELRVRLGDRFFCFPCRVAWVNVTSVRQFGLVLPPSAEVRTVVDGM